MENTSGFTNLHMDAIREVGNIGTGNAATALSRLIGRMVDMDVPVAELVPIYEVAAHYGSPETPVCAVLVRTEEEFSCSLIFMIEEEKANLMADLIIPMDISGMDEEMQLQIRNSALSEQGNIILGAFLNALAQITGWVLPTTTPAVARDMLGSIMDLVSSMFGVIGDSAMLVKTNLRIKDLEYDLSGNVIMIPDPGSLETLLSKLGVL
ncbi:chemotaxis protein CheC [Synergistaceae bacterium OttesenSCG-928-I11]|nr:chemotaxis protein CheC [Synergistaceae bacterium OttesenSCG-928-I11]